MAGRKTTVAPKKEAANLTNAEIREAIPKLKRRLADIEAFDPVVAGRSNSSAMGQALKDKIDGTLIDIFGVDSLEYGRFKIPSMYESGVLSIGGTWGRSHAVDESEGYRKGKDRALIKLSTAVEFLTEKLSDADELSSSASPKSLDGLELHDAVYSASARLFRDGYYAEAIEAACKSLNALVQVKSGRFDIDNTDLMQTVFSPKAATLAFNELKDDTDRGEQQGMMYLFAGIFLAFRNPRAHRLLSDDPKTAFGIIQTISFLANSIDKVTRKNS